MTKKKKKRSIFAAAILALLFFCICSPSLPAQASNSRRTSTSATEEETSTAENSVTSKFNTLGNLMASILGAIGSVVCLWGIFELGMALQTQDGTAVPSTFKRIAGGFIMAVAPELLKLFISG